MPRVHRHDRSAKTGIEQVSSDHGADRPRAVACADQCHRGRLEQVLEVTFAHATAPWCGCASLTLSMLRDKSHPLGSAPGCPNCDHKSAKPSLHNSVRLPP